MSANSTGMKGETEQPELKEVDDSPTGLTTAPIRGYTALSSKEIVEVVDRVAPVISEPSNSLALSSSNTSGNGITDSRIDDAEKATPNTYSGGGKGKSYGKVGGHSSLLQQRLRAGNIQHFDSGEHFRKQAEQTREQQNQRRQENRPHPLLGESSPIQASPLHEVTAQNPPEEVLQPQCGRIGRFRSMNPPTLLENRNPGVIPRRFEATNDSSEEYSD